MKIAVLLVSCSIPMSLAVGAAAEAPAPGPDRAPADAIVATLEPNVAALARDVLDRNPDLARLRATAEAASARAPQVRSLPDPMASLTAFLMTPETRVGPQQAAASVSQRFPWFGKLALRERRALLAAAAASSEVEAKRLALVTETRRLVYELEFLAAQEGVLRTDRATLSHYEELARARYASGVGLEQAVIKLQAEITRDDNRLLDLAKHRASLVSMLDKLRDRTSATALPKLELDGGTVAAPKLDVAMLRRQALDARPEVARARTLIAAADVGVELAKKDYKPDFTLGLGYTLVGKRSDAPGRASPPPGNGDDIVGVTLALNLPVRRDKLAAGVAESTAQSGAAADALRGVETKIDGELDDLVARLPLIHDQLDLFENVLTEQAEEALRSAEAAYSAGAASALDLLDAERVLLEVRIAKARSRADYQIAWSRLEGAVGAPLGVASHGGAE